MDLNAWIEKVAGSPSGHRFGRRVVEAAACLLGENPRTVYAWYRRERVPSFKAALRIVAASGRSVDFNGIYAPFAPKAPGVDHVVG
ncbi:hypothetical protein [Pseudomonas sp. NMI795_08]|uniref:hypothetical protein n=1 Tax=Pseudomonas sp. NMI795_08 TaxID=2903144 RepID=UPI001E513469|nr:hypothetical protein [Pseudomonas sp. NMI795_08]MCE1119076.1 hypothetical protein [Pseudomonas sp. NMI795_08]